LLSSLLYLLSSRYSLARLASSLPNLEVAGKVADGVANFCVGVSGVSTGCLMDSNSGGNSDVGSDAGDAVDIGERDKEVWR
jgi:hypothetical protein